MNDLALTTAGVLLILFVAFDVYATILDARARAGPVSEFLNRATWNVSRRVAFRLARRRRHRLLSYVGPLLMPSLIFWYIVLLVCAFALVYYPRMPSHFIVAEGVGADDWFNALYYSGVTLTTVGYGDISPLSRPMRLVSLLEAASGFALISLGVTYLITVYRALERKRAVALSFYHQAGEGADAAGFITHHFVSGQFYGLDGVLRNAARDLQELLESHVEHPVIHYFHPVEVYKSLPRVLFLTLETSTVIRSCLDPEEYEMIYRHPEVRTLESAASHVLAALAAGLDLERRLRTRSEPAYDEARRWENRFRQTLRKLQEAGIRTRPDASEAWELYRSKRVEWESTLYRFARYLGYDWNEVTGDRDLEYASDEAKEAPRKPTHAER